MAVAHLTRDDLRAYEDAFDEAWSEWQAGGEPIRRDSDWHRSIRGFARRGLPLDQLLVFVDDAMNNARTRPWKYLCGCCHGYLRERSA